MKIFIFIFCFITNLQAKVPSFTQLKTMQSHGNLKAKMAFDRLEAYGLLKQNRTNKTLIHNQAIGSNKKLKKSTSITLVEDSIKKILQSEIKQYYIPKIEQILGTCIFDDKGECIRDTPYSIGQFKNKTICMPNTNCNYYKCMEQKYHCSDSNDQYFTKLAYPACSKYLKNIRHHYFSKKAIDWIYTVMVCLQKKLTNHCELSNNCATGKDILIRKKTCQHIVDFSLKFHSSCYLNSGVGICHLSFRDKKSIWKTVRPFLTRKERKQAIKIVIGCIF